MSATVRRWTARELLDLVLDEGTFTSWDEPIDLAAYEPGYRAALEAAAAKAGTDESVLTGRGLVRGRPVAVVVNEFRFLAGSIGRAAADRIAAAVHRATAEGLPVLAMRDGDGGDKVGDRAQADLAGYADALQRLTADAPARAVWGAAMRQRFRDVFQLEGAGPFLEQACRDAIAVAARRGLAPRRAV